MFFFCETLNSNVHLLSDSLPIYPSSYSAHTVPPWALGDRDTGIVIGHTKRSQPRRRDPSSATSRRMVADSARVRPTFAEKIWIDDRSTDRSERDRTAIRITDRRSLQNETRSPGPDCLCTYSSKGSSAALCHYLTNLALHFHIRIATILLDCLNSQIQISTSG
jgi:hypothetical protein